MNLSVYDLQGRLVKNIFSGELEAGNHSVDWDGTNNFGAKVTSNVYFYKMKVNDYEVLKKMILVK